MRWNIFFVVMFFFVMFFFCDVFLFIGGMWKVRLEDDDSTCWLCQSRLDKSEQTSDWSRRPLSEKLVGRIYDWCQSAFISFWLISMGSFLF